MRARSDNKHHHNISVNFQAQYYNIYSAARISFYSYKNVRYVYIRIIIKCYNIIQMDRSNCLFSAVIISTDELRDFFSIIYIHKCMNLKIFDMYIIHKVYGHKNKFTR